MSVTIKTKVPVLLGTGETIDVGTVGNIVDYGLTDGNETYIMLRSQPENQLKRRLKFTIDFTTAIVDLIYPEQFDFVDEWGLLKSLLIGNRVEDVQNLSPTPVYRSFVTRPFAVTLVIDTGYRVTLIVDQHAGILDVELEKT